MGVPQTQIKISTMQDDLRAAQGAPAERTEAKVQIPAAKQAATVAQTQASRPSVALPSAAPARKRPLWSWLLAVLVIGGMSIGGGIWWYRKGSPVRTPAPLFRLLPAHTGLLLRIHSQPPPAGTAALRGFLQAVGCAECSPPAAVALIAEGDGAVRRVALFSAPPAAGIGTRVAKNWWAVGDKEAVEALRQRGGQRFEDLGWISDEKPPAGGWGELWVSRQLIAKLVAKSAPLGLAGTEGGWHLLLGKGEGRVQIDGEVARGEADESSPGAARDMLTAVPAQAFWAWGGADIKHDFNLWRLRNESAAPLAALLQELSAVTVEVREGKLEQVLTKPALAVIMEVARGPYALFVMREEDGSNSYGFVVALKAPAPNLPAALEALEPALAAWGKFVAKVPVDAPADFKEVEVRPGVKVRYVNFQGPSRSLDIAVLPDRLIITSSKLSMEAALSVSAETSLLTTFEPLLPAQEPEKEKRLLLWDFAAYLQAKRPSFTALLQPFSRLGLVEYAGGQVRGSAPEAASAE